MNDQEKQKGFAGNGHKPTLQRGKGHHTKPGDKDICTPQEIIFVSEYMIHWNATKAAITAGYSEKTAYSTSGKVLGRERVKLLIQTKLEEIKADYRLTHEAIAKYLLGVMYQDTTEILQIREKTQPDGTIKKYVEFRETDTLQHGVGRYFNKISISKLGINIEMFSKEKAVEMLARHVGFFDKDNQQKAIDGLQIYLPDNNRDSPAPSSE